MLLEVLDWVASTIDGRPPMSEIARTYRTAEKDMDKEANKLLRFLRAKEVNGDKIPVFLPSVCEVQPAVQQAEARLEQVRSDITEVLNCMGDEYNSLTSMIERVGRLRRTVLNVERDADNLVKQRINAGDDPEMASQHPDVQAALDKRDRVRSELNPQITVLKERVDRAKAILDRY